MADTAAVVVAAPTVAVEAVVVSTAEVEAAVASMVVVVVVAARCAAEAVEVARIEAADLRALLAAAGMEIIAAERQAMVRAAWVLTGAGRAVMLREDIAAQGAERTVARAAARAERLVLHRTHAIPEARRDDRRAR
ncbi:MAG: hypothetical protein ACRD59_19490 [Candidatus Acidiferrales bacterium]